MMMNTAGNGAVSKTNQTGSVFVFNLYVMFLAVAGLVYHKIAEGEYSSILTIAAIFQCLAFSLLALQVLTGSVSGISAKSLQLHAFALASRLSNTTWLDGYIPNDSTGDFLYQVFDGLSLAMALWLIHRVCKAQRLACESNEDGLPIAPFATACLVLSCVFHANLNAMPLFDSLWMNSLLLNTIAVMPQLWMLTHRKGSLPALASHFVAIMGLSHVLTGTYMWHGYDEITCDPLIGNFNHAGPEIIGAHIVHVLLLGDFAYYYVQNIANSGLEAPLPAMVSV